MPKEEWGTKRLCPHCATRFYDLQKDPMTCPACGNTFTLESLMQGRSRSLISDKSARGGDDQTDVLDDDDLDDDDTGGDLDDDLLDDDDDNDDVSLDDIADVAGDDEE
ncbi:MAG: TIGR02300 family protein [Paracoccus sp. (in: a-proteobacteria)]|uniref:TIGR02300 family protein n=1 Tax=Paracoccus sp. TaxID=267 RepID=UPI0026E0DD95|nr:TIGR02300 family protein [Paracoccus sp. (in: a-proteobacteria)]MDO5621055.1 TIGR02300 family protein [Paracoccus sp. (in: a-proteobacteria)]